MKLLKNFTIQIKVYILLGLIALFAAMFFLNLTERDPADVGIQTTPDTLKPASRIARAVPASNPQPACAVKSIKTEKPLYSIQGKLIPMPKQQTTWSILAAFDEAKRGNASAALQVFVVLNRCVPYSGLLDLGGIVASDFEIEAGFCRKLHSAIEDNPLIILEAAALAGSPEVKLLYAKNVDKVLKIQAFVKKPISNSGALLQRAEQFGFDAARHGIEEAYSFMAQAYQTGEFGGRDLSRAYAYTLVLEKMDDSMEMRNRMRFLSTQLTENQIIEAQRFAFGCERSQQLRSESLANPFAP